MTAITRTLAQFAASSRFDELPEAVQHEGARAFVNFVGCAAGGAREPVVERTLAVVSEFNGGPHASVIGRRERLDTLNAALINSAASAALAFNDTHYQTVAHPSSPVGAAALAIAERLPVSGQALIHSVILGIELQCRIGAILCTPPAEVSVGLSMQGLVGGIGAAVTAGKLMGLDAEAMSRAIGHAINQAAGLREAHASMGSPFTPGHSARCGVFAALLAERGLTINDTMIEGVKGFAVSYSTDPQPEAAVAELGTRFEILSLAYKPYPSGFVTHPVIDVCLDVARRSRFDVADIERVEVTVNPLTIHLCNRPEPKDRAQALVSFQHWGAVALIHKAAGTAQITQAMVEDPQVAALRRKFVATARPELAREAAELRVVLTDGSALTAKVERCIGSAGMPISDDDLARKTRGQLETAYAADVSGQILDQAWTMARLPRADGISALLAKVREA
jgi:2-methylcitrate dehydratase PrpD